PLFLLCAGLACGLDIQSTGPGSIEKASGESVKLDCQFTLANEDTGPLDIEWSLLPSDNQREDTVVLLYSGDRVYEDYHAPIKGRVHFNSSSDSGTYQCKVKKAPGIRSKKMQLRVMVKPARPRCSTQGPTQVGKNVEMRLNLPKTAPLWVSLQLNVHTIKKITDTSGGTITVKNASVDASGTYRCTASNRVGSEECVLQLDVTPPPNTAGIVAGSIIGVLLILLIIAIILFCFCRMRHKKKYEKEICNEIREDVPPPKSRVSTARSFTVGSQRSSLGSMSPSNMSNNLHEYVKPQYDKPQYDKIPSSDEYERPPSHVPLAPPTASRIDGSIV
uniref:CXADR Ig-like cell adhesion molecule n=1 Tax=Neogobius melanostomus TaxID=47308 RepID=A0A8C6TWT7_9GOBI